jgi:hypothetical protein
MKRRILLLIGAISVPVLISACVSQPATETRVLSNTYSAEQTASPNAQNGPIAPTSSGAPVATPTQQLCTWTLYHLYSDPGVLKVGQPALIWAFIYMEDFPAADFYTELLVNGQVACQKTVTVNFDEAWPFYFDFTPAQAGVDTVSVRAILAVNANPDAPFSGQDYYQIDAQVAVLD